MKTAKGKTRVVIVGRGVVFKFPRLTNLIEGVKANWREWRLWSKETNKTNSPLCPILFAIPGLLVVMRRADPMINVSRPRSFFDQLALTHNLTADLCAVNIGWSSAGPLVIDYGGPQFGGFSMVGTEGNEGPGLDGWID